MRYINKMLLIHLLVVTAVALLGSATVGADKQSYVADEYIVKVRAGSSLTQVQAGVAKIGGQLLRALPIKDTYLVKMTSKTKSRQFSALNRTAAATPWLIEAIQPNYLYYPTAEPNDARWEEQWDKVSMGMPRVWDKEKGSPAITVAVLDTGVAYDHPDLRDRVDHQLGYDFADDDNDPNDEGGHGTHVAGIIAAQGDNGIGVSGVCWDGVRILPIRVLGLDGGSTEMLVNGLEHAKSRGADIVNMSLGGLSMPALDDLALHSKIQELDSQEIVLVAAAGNDGDSFYPPYRYVIYPAAYEECIAVASTGPNDRLAYYSSYGPEDQVDITAPGGDQMVSYPRGGILSTAVNIVRDANGAVTSRALGYEYYQGTSMACPQVAGGAAILMSAGVAARDIRLQMTETARRPARGYDSIKFGAGILDLNAALGSSVVRILNPAQGSSSVSNPKVSIRLIAIDIDTVNVQLDGVDIIPFGKAFDFLDSNVNGISFTIPQPGNTALSPGPHTISASGQSRISQESVTDEVTFDVATTPVESGMYLFAFPYLVSANSQKPGDLLPGTTFATNATDRSRLIRWIAAPQQGRPGQAQYGYATYDPAITNDIAWDMTTANLSGYSWYVNGGYYNGMMGQVSHPIVGSGYWLVASRDTYIREDLPSLESRMDFDSSKGYVVRMYTGWNMIGNPYTRKVSWQTCLFRYKGETRALMSAVEAGWLSAVAYGYDSNVSRDYKRVTNRDSLEPFRGYWVRSYVGDSNNPLELIVLP